MCYLQPFQQHRWSRWSKSHNRNDQDQKLVQPGPWSMIFGHSSVPSLRLHSSRSFSPQSSKVLFLLHPHCCGGQPSLWSPTTFLRSSSSVSSTKCVGPPSHDGGCLLGKGWLHILQYHHQSDGGGHGSDSPGNDWGWDGHACFLQFERPNHDGGCLLNKGWLHILRCHHQSDGGGHGSDSPGNGWGWDGHACYAKIFIKILGQNFWSSKIQRRFTLKIFYRIGSWSKFNSAHRWWC